MSAPKPQNPMIPDKDAYLKQFKEYNEFRFKYHPEYIKLWKDKELFTDSDDKIIDMIIGEAARELGLEWTWIKDAEYLFGFYLTGSSEKDMKIKVPYSFSFKSLYSKIVNWYKKRLALTVKPVSARITVSESFMRKIEQRKKEISDKRKGIKTKRPEAPIEMQIYTLAENYIFFCTGHYVRTSEIDMNTGDPITRIYYDYNKPFRIISDCIRRFNDNMPHGDLRIAVTNDGVALKDDIMIFFFIKNGAISDRIKGDIDSNRPGALTTVGKFYRYSLKKLYMKYMNQKTLKKCQEFIAEKLKKEIKKYRNDPNVPHVNG